MTTQLLFYAFVGGIILNIMPCVLPVLTLKVFHLIHSASAKQNNMKLQSLFYAAGTTLTFISFAAMVVVLRGSGKMMGWGMHFQHPPFVAILCAAIFAFALNTLGLFELSVSSSAKSQDGLLGAFSNGIFAAVMSTPCTAPFLGTAAGFAMAADTPAADTILMFAFIGLGLAFPYVVINFVPMMAKLLPKPGAWMVKFKYFMGLTLLLTAGWLFSVLTKQISTSSLVIFSVFLVVLGAGLWAMGKYAGPMQGKASRFKRRAAITTVLAAVAWPAFSFDKPDAQAALTSASGLSSEAAAEKIVADWLAVPVNERHKGHIDWIPFSEERVIAAHRLGKRVFMDYTADWCVACKTNEKVILETETVRSALRDSGVITMKVDMTNENAVMDKWLAKLGRSGIPAYAVYESHEKVNLLPMVITTGIVVESLKPAEQKR